MRAFIAIELPDELIEKLGVIQDKLIEKSFKTGDISWPKPENIHLTLKFLGDIDPEKVEEIQTALQKAAEDIPPFQLSAGGIGAFPDLKAPRIIWVGIKESEGLARLQKNIDARLVESGFEKENRPFQPHLTLCRIKSHSAGRTIGKAAEALDHGGDTVFKIETFVLFKSELSPKGAKYSALKRIILKG